MRARDDWDQRHRGKPAGDPEAFVCDAISLLPPGGLVLDVAAGRGRHSLALARAGMRVVAIDYSYEGLRTLAEASRDLKIYPLAADLADFPLRTECYDAIVNVNFLDRALFPEFRRALKPGGMLVVDTYRIDQMHRGHPKSPEFLLKHFELRKKLSGMELVRYREGLVLNLSGEFECRASAVARKSA